MTNGNGVTRAMKRFLLKYCCCCCFDTTDDDDLESSSEGPSERDPLLGKGERERAAADILERVRDGTTDFLQLSRGEQDLLTSGSSGAEVLELVNEQRRKMDRVHREEVRAKHIDTPFEDELRKTFGVTQVQVNAKGAKAWNDLMNDRMQDVTPAKLVSSLFEGVKTVEPYDNMSIQVLPIQEGKEKGFILNINAKQKDAARDDNASWFRENCQISICRKITKSPEGRIIMVDERTDMRGGGCKELYRNLLPFYKALGVQEVTLSADEVGSYAWVRYGFRPDVEEWKLLREKIRASLEGLMLEGDIDDEQVSEIEDILASDDPNSIEAIANLEKPLGFRLLHKNIWKGTLDLTDKKMVAKLRQYIGE